MASSEQKLEISQSQEHAAAAAQTGSGDSNPLIEDSSAGRWANLSPKLKKAIVIGLVVGVLLLVALIILIVILAGHRCSLSPDPPGYMRPRPVYTMPDSKNLAKFVGYIHVYDLGFLALDIKRMKITDGPSSYIRLEDDCVSLNIGFTKPNKNTANAKISLDYIEWEFNGSGADESKRRPYEHCIIGWDEYRHKFETGYHYSCRERQTYDCWKSGSSVSIAQLVIDSFELELDGNEKIIYEGHFSKPAWPDSCKTRPASLSAHTIVRPVSSG